MHRETERPEVAANRQLVENSPRQWRAGTLQLLNASGNRTPRGGGSFNNQANCLHAHHLSNVSLTAWIGAESITIRSNSLSASSINRTCPPWAIFSAGFGAVVPPEIKKRFSSRVGWRISASAFWPVK